MSTPVVGVFWESIPIGNRDRDGGVIDNELANTSDEQWVLCNDAKNVKVELVTGDVENRKEVRRGDAVEFLAAGAHSFDGASWQQLDDEIDDLVGEVE
ncbi:hypothetical protein IL306_007350 [Fusarium sp. DS 682]|nr:hypothetical protein IL306_007350 [Fusarium sp. DS 682]